MHPLGVKVMTWSLGLFAAATSVLCAAPPGAVAQERAYEWGGGMHPMWGVWGLGMMLMMLVFWGVVIVGIVLGIRWLMSQARAPQPDKARYSPAALRAGRDQQGRVRGEEARPRVTGAAHILWQR